MYIAMFVVSLALILRLTGKINNLVQSIITALVLILQSITM